jgi:3-oxoacyl-[acyl-carrier-protein] synthase II
MPRFKRMDDLCRLGLAAIGMCLTDARIDRWNRKRAIALVAGTRYGCLRTDMNYHETVCDPLQTPSPSLFTYTLPNCFLGEAAIAFGLSGSAFVISDMTMADSKVLAAALDNLGICHPDGVLAGVCDLGPPPNVGFVDEALPVGALFVMLAKRRGNDGASTYGSLERDNGIICFNGAPLGSLIDLVEQCTRNS